MMPWSNASTHSAYLRLRKALLHPLRNSAESTLTRECAGNRSRRGATIFQRPTCGLSASAAPHRASPPCPRLISWPGDPPKDGLQQRDLLAPSVVLLASVAQTLVRGACT